MSKKLLIAVLRQVLSQHILKKQLWDLIKKQIWTLQFYVITDLFPSFLSFQKSQEKTVLLQLQSFLDVHGILEISQSGFKACHSTESAPLRVFNDLLLTTDSGDSAILMLLDLSAAFDTVDHTILISRLEHYVVSGTLPFALV